jgi:hypothetical protein
MNQKFVFRAAIVIVVFCVLSVGFRLMFPGRFDIAKWRGASSPADFNGRREMLGDIYKMLDNKTIHNRETTLRYLGPPQHGNPDTDTVWLYDLGGAPNATAPGPHDWLEIVFNTSGEVASKKIRQDSPDPE